MVISRQAFEQQWARRTEVRSKEDLLQEMIRFESLLAKARVAGIDRDPEVMVAFNRMVVGKFQEDQMKRRGLDSIQLSDAEIQEYYQTHLDRFTTPKQIRLGVIYCKTSTKATTEKREQLRQSAEALWSQAKEADHDSFRQLALQHSDDQATRYAGGDTGWFIPEQTGSRWEPEVIQTALALAEPGDLAPLQQTANGFYIVRLLGRQPESHRPLEQVRDGIEYQLRTEKAQQLHEEFFKEMQAGLTIEVNRAALDAVPNRVMQAEAVPQPSLPK
jgi:parvulin-like peptidyl-prolyl isomerase